MLHAERAGSTLGGSAGEVNAKKTEGVGAETPERLTSMSHGGGCGCKISPKVLDSILARMPEPQLPLGMPKDLIVGRDANDDAAVYRLSDEFAVVCTTDFFMPIVDSPFDFGRIAATNALSDIYAMGATPIFALAIVCMPVGRLPEADIAKILEGGQSVCSEAGVPIAGGHTIDGLEAIYGLVAVGVVKPSDVKKNGGARVGDAIILGKPIGVGVLSAALKKGKLSEEGYAELIRHTCKLNKPGMALSKLEGVHAMTDVTGFGLGGHTIEVCKASGVKAAIDWSRVRVIDSAPDLAASGCVTGASGRNWESYGGSIEMVGDPGPVGKHLLTDPQTSGGLLVACNPSSVEEVMSIFRADGFEPCVIGSFEELGEGGKHLRVTFPSSVGQPSHAA